MQVNKMGGEALDEAASCPPILCLILVVGPIIGRAAVIAAARHLIGKFIEQLHLLLIGFYKVGQNQQADLAGRNPAASTVATHSRRRQPHSTSG